MKKIEELLELAAPVDVSSLYTLKKACEKRNIRLKVSKIEKKQSYKTVSGFTVSKTIHDKFLTRLIVDHFVTFSKEKNCFTIKSTKELYRLNSNVYSVLQTLKKLKTLSLYEDKESIYPLIYKLLSEIESYRYDFDDDEESLLVIDFVEYDHRKMINHPEFIRQYSIVLPHKNKKSSSK